MRRCPAFAIAPTSWSPGRRRPEHPSATDRRWLVMRRNPARASEPGASGRSGPVLLSAGLEIRFARAGAARSRTVGTGCAFAARRRGTPLTAAGNADGLAVGVGARAIFLCHFAGTRGRSGLRAGRRARRRTAAHRHGERQGCTRVGAGNKGPRRERTRGHRGNLSASLPRRYGARSFTPWRILAA